MGIIGMVLNRKYRIDRLLGEGGFGVVYAATHLLLDEARALKFLRIEGMKDKEAALKRFLREAKLGSNLSHPGFVRVHEVEMWDATPYVVMELLNGQSLGERLAQRGRLAPTETLAIAIQVADALRVAHAHEIQHRDLKPDNLFLCDDGQTKVLDFGIARFASALRITRSGMIVGTPRYMAPEQIMTGHDIDARVDVYALGAVVYTCLAGKKPFFGFADDMSLLARIGQGLRPEPIDQAAPELPESICALISKAMHPDRNERYSSAEDFKRAAEACLSDAKHVRLGPSDPTFQEMPSPSPTPKSGKVLSWNVGGISTIAELHESDLQSGPGGGTVSVAAAARDDSAKAETKAARLHKAGHRPSVAVIVWSIAALCVSALAIAALVWYASRKSMQTAATLPAATPPTSPSPPRNVAPPIQPPAPAERSTTGLSAPQETTDRRHGAKPAKRKAAGAKRRTNPEAPANPFEEE